MPLRLYRCNDNILMCSVIASTVLPPFCCRYFVYISRCNSLFLSSLPLPFLFSSPQLFPYHLSFHVFLPTLSITPSPFNPRNPWNFMGVGLKAGPGNRGLGPPLSSSVPTPARKKDSSEDHIYSQVPPSLPPSLSSYLLFPILFLSSHLPLSFPFPLFHFLSSFLHFLSPLSLSFFCVIVIFVLTFILPSTVVIPPLPPPS